MNATTSTPAKSVSSSGSGSASGIASRQENFAHAILDPNMPAPTGLVGPDGLPSEKRFAVYRNNVIVGLIETLKAAYPVIHRLVGDAFFTAMARIYVMQAPPSSPIMLDYGAEFAHFVEVFPPAASLPYLADIARLERAWTEAYHSAEAAYLSPSDLARLNPADIPSLWFRLHPSLRILRSSWPIVTIWAANLGDKAAQAISLERKECEVLVARPDAEVEIRHLPEGAGAFMQSLTTGATLAQALGAGLDASPRFDLETTLRGMAEARVIIGCGTKRPEAQEAA